MLRVTLVHVPAMGIECISWLFLLWRDGCCEHADCKFVTFSEAEKVLITNEEGATYDKLYWHWPSPYTVWFVTTNIVMLYQCSAWNSAHSISLVCWNVWSCVLEDVWLEEIWHVFAIHSFSPFLLKIVVTMAACRKGPFITHSQFRGC